MPSFQRVSLVRFRVLVVHKLEGLSLGILAQTGKDVDGCEVVAKHLQAGLDYPPR
jgi:hypothetical protein